MWFYRARIWFSIQVLLFNCVFTLPLLAAGSHFNAAASFLSIGFVLALVTVHLFFKQERFVMLNLGVSKRSLVIFAWFFQIVALLAISFIVFLCSQLVV